MVRFIGKGVPIPVMAEAIPSYSLERKLDLAASYLLQTEDAELRKVSPKLVKAKRMILDSNGVAQYRAGVDAIETLNAIVVTDRLYGEKAATKIAAETGYNFKPLLDVLGKDSAALGLPDGLKLHEIYEKVVEKGNTELHRLVAEMAPYNEIIGAAKNCKDVELKGAARKVYDFDTGVKMTKREQMRKVSIPIFALSSTLAGGPIAGVGSAVTLSLFSYGREAVYRAIDAAPKAGSVGGKIGKILNKTDAYLNKVGFSISYGAILGAEKAVGMPINWDPVLLYTIGIQGITVAGRKAKAYSRKIKAAIRTMKEGYGDGKFRESVRKNESEIEAEEQLQKGPEKTKRGWIHRQARKLNMKKVPFGKTKYIDLAKMGLGERLNEKEIVEDAGRKFAGDLGKRYSPGVRDAILGEYLTNSKISEEEFVENRGAAMSVMGTTITDSSKNARRFGGSEYSFKPSYCEQVAKIRAGVLEREGYDCETGENGDVMAFHKSGNGRKKLKEVVLLHQKDALVGTSVKFLEDAVRGGGIVQFPNIGKNGIEGWDLQDYRVFVSDLLEEEMAVPVLYHELTAHVGNRLEAFETMKRLGEALSQNEEALANNKRPKM